MYNKLHIKGSHMYQTIYPHQFHNHYCPRKPHSGDIFLSYDGRNILLKKDQTPYVYEDLPKDISYRFLFTIDDTAFFLADLMFMHPISLDIQTLRKYEPQQIAFAGITGWHLYDWYRSNQYCGRCGSLLIDDTKERALRCTKCGNLIYPRINPVVIVAIKNEQNQLLVTKYAHAAYAKYALVAGFVEIGETLEEAAKREAKEETGLDIEDLHYYKNQPWGYSSSLIVSFTAIAKGNQTIKLDRDELKIAEWVNQNDTFIDPHDAASITSEMIHNYLEGKL